MLFLFQNIRPYFFFLIRQSYLRKVFHKRYSNSEKFYKKYSPWLFIHFFEEKKCKQNSYSYGYYENIRKNIASRIAGGFE